MTHRLVVRHRGPGLALAWLAEDERGRVIAGPHADADVPAALRDAAREIVILVPGEAVLVARTQVVARTREQLARAVPFALEDQLAEPLDALHVSAESLPGGGQIALAVRRVQLVEWLDDLRRRGLTPDRLLPDTLALPHADDRTVLLHEGERVLLRAGVAQAIALAPEELGDWLQHAPLPRDAAGRPPLQWFECGRSERDLLAGVDIAVERVDQALPLLARGLRAGPLPNLLSGEFATRHRGEGARRLWRWAAGLAAAAAALALLHAGLERWMLQSRLDAISAEQRALYLRAFPEARNIPNPVGQMEAALRQAQVGGSGRGALPLLARIAPVLANGTQHQLLGVDFRGGVLELTVQAPAVAALDALRESAAAVPGVIAELAAASATERGAEGRLRIREREAAP